LVLKNNDLKMNFNGLDDNPFERFNEKISKVEMAILTEMQLYALWRKRWRFN